MRFFHGIIVPVLMFILFGCTQPRSVSRVPADWRERELVDLRDKLTNWPCNGDARVRLSVASVAQLDAGTLLVGGSYESIDPIRSVLLRSDDGGRSWRDTCVWLTGSVTSSIFVLDAHHAWAVVHGAVEGWSPPFVVFRTTDGGRTWQRSRQDLPLGDENANLPLEFGIRFASPDVGIAWLVGPVGDQYHYLTTDGGMTWRLVYQSKIKGVLDDLPDSPQIDREHSADGVARIRARYAGEGGPHIIDIPESGYRMRDDGGVERE